MLLRMITPHQLLLTMVVVTNTKAMSSDGTIRAVCKKLFGQVMITIFSTFFIVNDIQESNKSTRKLSTVDILYSFQFFFVLLT